MRKPDWKPWEMRNIIPLPSPLPSSADGGRKMKNLRDPSTWFWRCTGWLEEFSRSLSHRNYTFCSKKFLLVPSRHSRSLGFQPCIPIFHIHLCTVGHQNFQDQKFEIGLLATQKQIKTYWMTKPHQNNHKKFWLAGFFNTSKNLQNKEKNIPANLIDWDSAS